MVGNPILCILTMLVVSAPLASSIPGGVDTRDRTRTASSLDAATSLPAPSLEAVLQAAAANGLAGQFASSSVSFAHAVADPMKSPTAVLESLDPLLQSHAAFVQSMVPGSTFHSNVQASVDEAQAYVAALQHGPGPGASDREKVLWALEMQPRPEPKNPVPALPQFATLREALSAHFATYGRAPSQEEAVAIERLNGLPQTSTGPLTRIIEAHLFAAEVTRLAFENFTAPQGPVSVDQLTFDVGLLMEARDRVADVVLTYAPLVASIPFSNEPWIHVCGIILINLTEDDNVYTCDVPLSFDRGGNDTFAFNAGGTMAPFSLGALPPIRPTALHIDGAGDDWYNCNKESQGINGGAYRGSGFLFDLGGNENYSPTMSSSGAINGGAVDGVGLFVDTSGDEEYFGSLTGNGSFTGGSLNGVGAFVDLSGHDYYNPTFTAGIGAHNGGAWGGRGYLVDFEGNDGYTGTAASDAVAGGSGLNGVGVLLDLQGDDTHLPDIAGDGIMQGSGVANGTGILIDVLGNDSYKGRADAFAVSNGASRFGAGLLLDLAGATNEFLDPGAPSQIVNGASIGGLGLLLTAGAADDDYLVNGGIVHGAGDLYGVGIVIDRGGSDELQAGPSTMAFGVGRSGGLGIWVDGGGFDVLSVTGGLALARGAQGIGLVVRPNNTSHINVADYAPASTFAATGGGIGIWSDNGTFTQQGQGPVVGCTRTSTFQTQPLGPFDAFVCQPDPDGGQDILSPVTGTPIGAASKTPVPCRSTTVGSVDCGDEVESLLGENWVNFLESDEVTNRMSGGLEIIDYRPTPTGSRDGGIVLEIHTYDRTCDPNCDL